MKNAQEFAGSIPLNATANEIQRIAVAEFEADPDRDTERVDTERTDAHRMLALATKAREIIGDAWRGGAFAGITSDHDDYVLLIEYLLTMPQTEALRWSAISDSLAPEPFDSE